MLQLFLQVSLCAHYLHYWKAVCTLLMLESILQNENITYRLYVACGSIKYSLNRHTEYI